MKLPEDDMVAKCSNRKQLTLWLDETLLDIKEIQAEIDESISEGRNPEHREDRRYFDRLFKLRRERGQLVNRINSRLYRLRQEPPMSFEEYFLQQLEKEIGQVTFKEILEKTRLGYQAEVLGRSPQLTK